MDNMRDNEESGMEFCLVCCSKVENSEEKDNLLSENLLVVFLLKNVLQVADEQLEEYLRDNGNPVDWIMLCEECCQLSRQALELHCQVIKIDRQLCSVQKLIVEKTKSSLSVPVPEVSQGHQSDLWKRTRALVKQANLQNASLPLNPFIEGDKLAAVNDYLRKELDSQRDKLGNCQDGILILLNSVGIKTEQLMPTQSISDDENDGDNDDWQPEPDCDGRDNDDDDLSDQSSSESLTIRTKKPRKIARKRMRTRINGKVKCLYCDKLFSQTTGCLMHENEKHPKIPGRFPCGLCGRVWNSKECYTKHIKYCKARPIVSGKDAEEPKDPLSTQPTTVKTEVGENLDVNLEDPVECDNEISGFGDEDGGIVDTKMRKVLGRVLNKSSEFTGSDPNKVRRKVDGKVKCDYCDKLFSGVRGCIRHELERHPKVKGQWPCDICGKAWNSREYLRRHLKRGHKIDLTKIGGGEKRNDKLRYTSRDKPFGCKLCDMKFRDRFGLGKHKRAHENQKRRNVKKNEQSSKIGEVRKSKSSRIFEWVDGKVKCGSCDKKFSHKNTMFHHERVKHLSEEGQYICDLCGKVYSYLYRLQVHKKTVHLLKADGSVWVPPNNNKRRNKVKDGLPLKRGRRKEALKYLRVDGKLKCNSCDRLLATTHGMHRHEREKHPTKPGEFVCTHCGMTFNSLEYLRVHTERKHWLRLDGTEKIPPWVATRKYKWKKSEK